MLFTCKADMVAIVLAAGRGNTMSPLNIDKCKAEVRVQNKELFIHAITNLRDSGFTMMYVIIQTGSRIRFRTLMSSNESLFRNVNVIFCEVEPEIGNVEGLKTLYKVEKISPSEDVLLYSVDTVTNFPVLSMVNDFRAKEPDLVMLLSNNRSGSSNREVIGLDDERMVTFYASLNDYNDSLCIDLEELNTEGSLRTGSSARDLQLTQSLTDLHVYILSGLLMEKVLKINTMNSFKDDLLPHLIRSRDPSDYLPHRSPSLERVRFTMPPLPSVEKGIRARSRKDKTAIMSHKKKNKTLVTIVDESCYGFRVTSQESLKSCHLLMSSLPEEERPQLLHKESMVHPSVKLTSSMVDRGCNVGSNCVISKCTIGEGVTIAANCILTDSILMHNVRLDEKVTLNRVLVLPDVSIGSYHVISNQTVEETVADKGTSK